jgi:hypothetical protein
MRAWTLVNHLHAVILSVPRHPDLGRRPRACGDPVLQALMNSSEILVRPVGPGDVGLCMET